MNRIKKLVVQSKYEDGIVECRKEYQNLKKNPTFLLFYAKCFMETGENENALRLLEKILKLDEFNKEAFKGIIKIKESEGKFSECAKYYNTVLNEKLYDIKINEIFANICADFENEETLEFLNLAIKNNELTQESREKYFYVLYEKAIISFSYDYDNNLSDICNHMEVNESIFRKQLKLLTDFLNLKPFESISNYNIDNFYGDLCLLHAAVNQYKQIEAEELLEKQFKNLDESTIVVNKTKIYNWLLNIQMKFDFHYNSIEIIKESLNKISWDDIDIYNKAVLIYYYQITRDNCELDLSVCSQYHQQLFEFIKKLDDATDTQLYENVNKFLREQLIEKNFSYFDYYMLVNKIKNETYKFEFLSIIELDSLDDVYPYLNYLYWSLLWDMNKPKQHLIRLIVKNLSELILHSDFNPVNDLDVMVVRKIITIYYELKKYQELLDYIGEIKENATDSKVLYNQVITGEFGIMWVRCFGITEDYDYGVTIAHNLIRNDSCNVELWILLGDLIWSRGQSDYAIKIYQKVIDLIEKGEVSKVSKIHIYMKIASCYISNFESTDDMDDYECAEEMFDVCLNELDCGVAEQQEVIVAHMKLAFIRAQKYMKKFDIESTRYSLQYTVDLVNNKEIDAKVIKQSAKYWIVLGKAVAMANQMLIGFLMKFDDLIEELLLEKDATLNSIAIKCFNNAIQLIDTKYKMDAAAGKLSPIFDSYSWSEAHLAIGTILLHQLTKIQKYEGTKDEMINYFNEIYLVAYDHLHSVLSLANLDKRIEQEAWLNLAIILYFKWIKMSQLDDTLNTVDVDEFSWLIEHCLFKALKLASILKIGTIHVLYYLALYYNQVHEATLLEQVLNQMFNHYADHPLTYLSKHIIGFNIDNETMDLYGYNPLFKYVTQMNMADYVIDPDEDFHDDDRNNSSLNYACWHHIELAYVFRYYMMDVMKDFIQRVIMRQFNEVMECINASLQIILGHYKSYKFYGYPYNEKEESIFQDLQFILFLFDWIMQKEIHPDRKRYFIENSTGKCHDRLLLISQLDEYSFFGHFDKLKVQEIINELAKDSSIKMECLMCSIFYPDNNTIRSINDCISLPYLAKIFKTFMLICNETVSNNASKKIQIYCKIIMKNIKMMNYKDPFCQSLYSGLLYLLGYLMASGRLGFEVDFMDTIKDIYLFVKGFDTLPHQLVCLYNYLHREPINDVHGLEIILDDHKKLPKEAPRDFIMDAIEREKTSNWVNYKNYKVYGKVVLMLLDELEFDIKYLYEFHSKYLWTYCFLSGDTNIRWRLLKYKDLIKNSQTE